MAIDQKEIGAVAAELMEDVEKENYGEEATVRAVGLVVAVKPVVGGGDVVHYQFTKGLSFKDGLALLACGAEAFQRNNPNEKGWD